MFRQPISLNAFGETPLEERYRKAKREEAYAQFSRQLKLKSFPTKPIPTHVEREFESACSQAAIQRLREQNIVHQYESEMVEANRQRKLRHEQQLERQSRSENARKRQEAERLQLDASCCPSDQCQQDDEEARNALVAAERAKKLAAEKQSRSEAALKKEQERRQRLEEQEHELKKEEVMEAINWMRWVEAKRRVQLRKEALAREVEQREEEECHEVKQIYTEGDQETGEEKEEKEEQEPGEEELLRARAETLKLLEANSPTKEGEQFLQFLRRTRESGIELEINDEYATFKNSQRGKRETAIYKPPSGPVSNPTSPTKLKSRRRTSWLDSALEFEDWLKLKDAARKDSV